MITLFTGKYLFFLMLGPKFSKIRTNLNCVTPMHFRVFNDTVIDIRPCTIA